jgi:hypothetical protein
MRVVHTLLLLAFWEEEEIKEEPCLDPKFSPQIPLCKKEIPHHIKMSANAWSTKCMKSKTNCTVLLYFTRRTF